MPYLKPPRRSYNIFKTPDLWKNNPESRKALEKKENKKNPATQLELTRKSEVLAFRLFLVVVVCLLILLCW